MKMSIASTALALAASLLLTAGTPAQAFKNRTCNPGFGTVALKLPGTSATIRYSATSFPSDGGWLGGLQNTIAQYNRNPSNFTFSLAADTNGLGLDNGESETWGDTDQSILQGAPAIAYSYWNCNIFSVKMKEGDVIFDYTSTATRPFRWTPSQQKTALFSYTAVNGKRLIQGTGMHEFGHVSGLLHETRTYNVMGADFTHLDTNSTTVNAYVGEDTGNGLVSLYGVRSSGPLDAGVAHWRRTGDDGEYSSHGRTRLFSTGGIELTKSLIGAEPIYNVTRGNTFGVEFTYENVGRATLTNLPVRFYISSNDTITTFDRQVGAVTLLTLSRDAPATLRHFVTIPVDAPANASLWLGVIVNPTSSIAESYRANNTSYIRIHTN